MRRKQAQLDPYWETLAVYNSEVARGIVHSPEWVADMERRQEAWNRRSTLYSEPAPMSFPGSVQDW